jgi:hypothetical protein
MANKITFKTVKPKGKWRAFDKDLGFTVKSKNGKEYGDKTFHSMLGYVTLDKIFVKI